MSTKVKRVSRSAVNTRKQCEMRRYLAYELRGQGVSPVDFAETDNTISLAALPKVRGAIFHDLSLAIIQGQSVQEWTSLLTSKAQAFPPSIRTVQEVLIRRAMMGWQLVRGQQWAEEFNVISAEESWVWPITPTIHEPLRLDKILQRKDDGALGIFDYKTMGTVSTTWIDRMDVSDQTHLYLQALKERSDQWVIGICYDGVVIGKLEKGIQRSPFVTGWKKNDKVMPKWAQGAEYVDLANFDDQKWLDWIQKTGALMDLYPTTGWLNPPPEQLLQTKRSVGRAEEEFDFRISLIENIRTTHGEDSAEYQESLGLLEKNPDACYKYGFGHACPFVAHCWRGAQVGEQFEPRQDHHAELEDE